MFRDVHTAAYCICLWMFCVFSCFLSRLDRKPTLYMEWSKACQCCSMLHFATDTTANSCPFSKSGFSMSMVRQHGPQGEGLAWHGMTRWDGSNRIDFWWFWGARADSPGATASSDASPSESSSGRTATAQVALLHPGSTQHMPFQQLQQYVATCMGFMPNTYHWDSLSVSCYCAGMHWLTKPADMGRARSVLRAAATASRTVVVRSVVSCFGCGPSLDPWTLRQLYSTETCRSSKRKVRPSQTSQWISPQSYLFVNVICVPCTANCHSTKLCPLEKYETDPAVISSGSSMLSWRSLQLPVSIAAYWYGLQVFLLPFCHVGHAVFHDRSLAILVCQESSPWNVLVK